MTINELATGGGLLSLLTLNHFAVDWIFQTHNEAMKKHNHAWVRARHCGIYALGFIPLLLLMKLAWLPMLIALNVLFWSHFIVGQAYSRILICVSSTNPNTPKTSPPLKYLSYWV